MAERQENPDTFCVAWLPDGKSFVIRNTDEFTRTVLPHYFKATKFSSYTRKLYRWGFRQVNRGIGPDDPIIFGNEYFQRDNAELMTKMRSITAAGTRKAASSSSTNTTSSSSESASSYTSPNNQVRATMVSPATSNTQTIGLPPSHKERLMMMEAAAAAAALASNNALSQSILFPSTSSILKRSLEISNSTSNPSFPLEHEHNYRKRVLLEHMMLHYNNPKRNLQAAAAAAAVAAASGVSSSSTSSLHPMNLNTASSVTAMGSLGTLCHSQRSLLNLSTPALSNLYAASSNPLNFLLASNHHHHHQSQLSSLTGLLSSNSPYNPNSTADIVNAAINALRFAS
jgi:HSF-type DNA-binding